MLLMLFNFVRFWLALFVILESDEKAVEFKRPRYHARLVLGEIVVLRGYREHYG